MNNQPNFINNPIDVRNRLSDLDLTPAECWEVIQAAVAGRNGCTENDPCSAPGWDSWRYGNRRLREIQLRKAGWIRDEADNIPSVFHPEKKLKITVTNTDEGTGLIDHIPQQTTRKGSATERLISVNESLFGDMLQASLNVVPITKLMQPGFVACWYLCVYCEGDVVRAELSCPILSEDGRFKAFHERIVLTDLGGDGGGVKLRKPQPDGGSDFEIPVVRKRAS